MTTVADVSAAAERLWPLSGAEDWDAPGLLSGDPAATVSRIVLAVDAVADTVDEAVELGADLLLVHHPLLMRGVTTVAESTAKGALLSRLIRGGCALYSAHTNADIVASGTSARLAELLQLTYALPIVETAPGLGLGRVGALAEPTTLGALARQLAGILPPTATGVRVAGQFDRPVSRVALCGGAGDSLLGEPAVRSADVYITSDLRHHPASESVETARVAAGPALIDVSHWASEWLWLETAAAELRGELPGVDVIVSELRTDPWDFVVVQ
ncbi:MAG: Nif3-like dinuclear metal center hexameric protein [Microcella sp.]|uniref:Nif3-like dinuclear metal center hexameric protein n=1 Tax=Microcella sp. TaxID=1913979 RepID=UPI0024C50EE1|nr:Nif3-like dinuclear metal center hexameric protein [Microcella sp.]UYN84121.1 MAG: Nif3-like dinuclear metal center hexameric protein [Microcella sp.]